MRIKGWFASLSREINNSMKRQGGMEDIGMLTLMIYFHCAELRMK